MRLKMLVLLAILAVVAIFVTVSSANKPRPLPPPQAQNAATHGHSRGATRTVVPLSSVENAAQQPGAYVEGTPPANPSQAAVTKLAATAAVRTIRPFANVGDYVCWNFSLWSQHGTWPYQQRVTEQRYQCAYYGKWMYYRVTHVLLGTTLCSGSGAYAFIYSGGNFYTWAEVQAGGNFSCPTNLPYVTLHTQHWQRFSVNVWGNWSGYDD
jgi:hypothetical protein